MTASGARKRKTNNSSEKSSHKKNNSTSNSTPTVVKRKTPTTIGESINDWIMSLFDEVDNISLVIFRIMWGLIMAWECWTFIRNDYYKLNMYYVIPQFAPKYFGFFWVHAWEGNGMYIHIWVMFVAAMGVASGFLFKFCSVIYFLGFTYLILLDACLYLNHFYLIAVMAFILILLPANRRFSIDALISPSIYTNTMPRYIVVLLRTEQVIVYFYAGIAKINEDWLRGEPVRHWIPGKVIAFASEHPNNLFAQVLARFLDTEGGVYFIAIGGLLFDLFGGFLLCTSGILFKISLINCIFFHLMNKFLMNIGIFPWVMLASTTLFFEPDWVYRIPGVTKLVSPAKPTIFTGKISLTKKIVLIIMALFIIHQIATPLRHHFYPGDVAWNEMGHRYSWRMKLRDKQCDVNMVLHDPTTDKNYNIDFNSYLFGKQVRKIKPRPELLIQFAHYVAHKFEDSHGTYPEVYADLVCALNYRKPQRMFRLDADLAAAEPYDWNKLYDIMVPLEPLSEEEQKDSILNWDKFMSLLTNPFQPRKKVENPFNVVNNEQMKVPRSNSKLPPKQPNIKK